MITRQETGIARDCIAFATANGADGVRISLTKSVTDSCTMLNGELDKVSHSADRSIFIYLFVDGRYGTFSTNRLEKAELEDFIIKAIAMVRMLGEDRCRTLPAPERMAYDASEGQELGLYDSMYEKSDAESRLKCLRDLSIFRSYDGKEDFTLLSEECEYTESYEDNVVMDSQGFEGRHTETSFSAFTEMTVEDAEGNKYSGFWWEAFPTKSDLGIDRCGRMALKRAADQIGPRNRKGGRYRMVVDTNVASRLVSPIFTALNASSIQQKMSFLDDSLDRKVFPEGMTLMDLARTPGKAGSRLFDTEGVATSDSPVIENGIVRKYFVSTYMSNKMGIKATVEDISRPCMMPFLKGKSLPYTEKELSLKDILRICGNGILVTGFNGGNCNPVTGDYSFGVEGFAFSKGRISHPVKEMLITGNLMELWNNLLAAGTDARPSVRWQIPTLAFEDVSFSA